MIRHTQGPDWLLFTQHDHALLSGRLAESIHGNVIATLSSEAVQGIALHDCGWPLHDDRPTLNPAGQPLHVFESPVWIACQVWTASARRAANKDHYAGLLVSIHGSHLATLSAQIHHSPRDSFELNKFQHAQVELQEALRRSLELRTDIPTNHGLAAPRLNPREDQLRFDYHLLRAMDRLSLALLCSENLFTSIDQVDPHPGAEPISLHLTRPQPFHAQMNPWPFESPQLAFDVPCRRIPIRSFADVDSFRDIYAQAAVEQIAVVIQTSP